MSYTERRAHLLPASLRQLQQRGIRLPVLPAWAPLNPAPTDDEPNPRPYTEQERTARRERLQLRLAAEGPYDGTRLYVMVQDGQPPPEHFVPADVPTCRYVLDGADATGVLRYRYDPTSPIHADLMRAVEDAYAEHTDPAYAAAARTDDEHAPVLGDRPTPGSPR